MKRILLSLLALVGVTTAVLAQQQKVCYIYSQKVLQSMPEYKAAVNELEQMTESAREKSDALFGEAKQMFDEFQKYQERMSEAQYNRYKEMVIQKEKEANDYEESMFGEKGAIAEKQRELMEPLEKRVMAAVESFATANGYDMVYDLSIVKATIYQSPKLDMTDKIIEKLKN